MPKKVTPEQRQAVLGLLAQGQDRDTIAAAVGVTPGQVSAISAHVKMGTYALPEPEEQEQGQEPARASTERTANVLQRLQSMEPPAVRKSRLQPILLGADAETDEDVFWNPDPACGTPNPHVLILG